MIRTDTEFDWPNVRAAALNFGSQNWEEKVLY